jgi:DNA helicase-2/ATP-dependent DNA helicase PcrA
MRPYSAINYILKGIGYEEYLKEHAKSRKINFDELRECAYEIRERSKPFASFREWFEHIENYEEEMKQRKQENREQKEEGVSIVTIHVSKGLEYHTVFILTCNEGNMPYKKAVTKEEVEEERRMFYVAMTRAKEKLFLSYIEMSHEKSVAPSRFLNDLDNKKEQ